MIDQVRPNDLSAWMQAQPGGSAGVVLDVREPWELQTASVQPDGFALRPSPWATCPRAWPSWTPTVPVACLCHHGARSQRVAAFLAAQGFEPMWPTSRAALTPGRPSATPRCPATDEHAIPRKAVSEGRS
jgi:rhodanese-related sulfurtransferase